MQVNPGEAFTIQREDGQFQCITGKTVTDFLVCFIVLFFIQIDWHIRNAITGNVHCHLKYKCLQPDLSFIGLSRINHMVDWWFYISGKAIVTLYYSLIYHLLSLFNFSTQIRFEHSAVLWYTRLMIYLFPVLLMQHFLICYLHQSVITLTPLTGDVNNIVWLQWHLSRGGIYISVRIFDKGQIVMACMVILVCNG